jgi:hypothetical protein
MCGGIVSPSAHCTAISNRREPQSGLLDGTEQNPGIWPLLVAWAYSQAARSISRVCESDCVRALSLSLCSFSLLPLSRALSFLSFSLSLFLLFLSRSLALCVGGCTAQRHLERDICGTKVIQAPKERLENPGLRPTQVPCPRLLEYK